MKNLSALKISFIVIMYLITGIFLSCKKDIQGENETIAIPEQKPDLTTKVTSSVSGFVTDQNNAPVVGATVKAGTATILTDRYGFFEIKNVQVVKEAATVTVQYPGYFKGIKTYMAAEGRSAFFRITLLQKTIAGTIDAVNGGSVSLSNGTNISFPINGIKDAASGALYIGTVNVAAQYIDPTSPELSSIMPGDLRGINTEGYIRGLISFGMLGIELTGSSGELLQIADGKKSILTMMLPASITGSAPETIPLWYFDEINGLWKEEGTATKTGNSYVGEVSHFSFWNCDIPNAIVPLTFTVVDATGKALSNAHVVISTNTFGSWPQIGGWTDLTGYVSLFVTPNTSYSLDIFGNCNNGGSPAYSQTFSVTTTAVNLGDVVIGSSELAYVSGTITDCSGNPVTNGYLIVSNGYQNTRYALNNPGAYNFSTLLCSGGPTNVNLIAVDLASSQQAAPLPHTLTSGTNTISNIMACGLSTAVFLHYSADGGITFEDMSPPDDTVYQNGPGQATIYIAGYDFSTNPAPNVHIGMDNAGIAAGSIQNLGGFNFSPLIPEGVSLPAPIGVHITEYGAIGSYIAGNFSGTVTGTTTGASYPVVCSFRIRRDY